MHLQKRDDAFAPAGKHPALRVPRGVRVLENPRPLSFAANVNVGVAATTGEYILVANPDAIPEPGAVPTLSAFADGRPRCGIAGPRMLWPDGSRQPSRRRFPTVRGTLVRRTPLRLLFPPFERQRAHYGLDEDPDEPADRGNRHYCEDIDLCYRAAKAGWERWYVPQAVVWHEYAAVIDRRFLSRHTVWHLSGMFRFVRKHPERLTAV